MDLDDEELRATKDKFYHKEIKKEQINEVVKRLINSEEKKNENS